MGDVGNISTKTERFLARGLYLFTAKYSKMSSAPSAAELISVGGERTSGDSVRTQNSKA